MRKYLNPAVAVISAVFLISCGNHSDTPQSVAEKWCSLNAKVHLAKSEEEKARAEKTLEIFEKELNKNHDEEFIRKAGDGIEKCEDASEGR